MIVDEIALSLQKGINRKVAVRLMEEFGDAASLYGATAREIVARSSLREDLAREITLKPYHKQAEAEIGYCRRSGITPVGCSSEEYPALLKECCDFPTVLYVMGDAGALAGEMLAVVGTRKVSPYGSAVCRSMVEGLAEYGQPLTIVSGLAYGVDAEAHRAALSTGLKTVAVLGNRLPRIYPSEHGSLARKITESGGCLVSELHSGAAEGRMNFVARNRLIAGMSAGTLIVESPLKGGSMITAEMASGYDRAVMAVPGRINDGNSSGTNHLIRSNRAALVASAADIMAELGLDAAADKPQPAAAAPVGMSPVEVRLLEIIVARDGATVDTLADVSALPASAILAALFSMELAGAVRKAPGGLYIKN